MCGDRLCLLNRPAVPQEIRDPRRPKLVTANPMRQSYYVWKRKFGSMSEPDVKRARDLEKENARLKRLLAERDVEIDVMKEIIEKKLPT